MKIERIRVLDIYQDSNNPRHDPIENEHEIIELLVKEGKVKSLAKDIADVGISPLELFALVKDENGNYIAVEGNRRLCALTLLNDPEISPSKDKKYFQQLSEKSTEFPEHVNCIIFPSRDEANIWIERRHNGEQDGVGLVPWNSVQKARFFGSSENTLALKVLDYAVKEGLLTEEERKGRILTTASRFLGNPLLRSTMGITSSRTDPAVMIDVPEDEFKRVLQQFCRDLVDGTNNVTSRSRKSDWEDYAKSLKNKGIAPTQHIDARKLGSTQNTEKAKPAQGRNRNPDLRRNIIPNSFKVSIKDKTLKRVFDEACKIDCDNYALATTLVTRVFLETIYGKVYKKITGKEPSDKTHILLDKIIPILETHSLTKEQKGALGALKRIKSNENEVFSPKTLGAYAHAGHLPDPRQIKLAWDNIEEIIGYMINFIEK